VPKVCEFRGKKDGLLIAVACFFAAEACRGDQLAG
jgi:hypothetical protein